MKNKIWKASDMVTDLLREEIGQKMIVQLPHAINHDFNSSLCPVYLSLDFRGSCGGCTFQCWGYNVCPNTYNSSSHSLNSHSLQVPFKFIILAVLARLTSNFVSPHSQRAQGKSLLSQILCHIPIFISSHQPPNDPFLITVISCFW